MLIKLVLKDPLRTNDVHTIWSWNWSPDFIPLKLYELLLHVIDLEFIIHNFIHILGLNLRCEANIGDHFHVVDTIISSCTNTFI